MALYSGRYLKKIHPNLRTWVSDPDRIFKVLSTGSGSGKKMDWFRNPLKKLVPGTSLTYESFYFYECVRYRYRRYISNNVINAPIIAIRFSDSRNNNIGNIWIRRICSTLVVVLTLPTAFSYTHREDFMQSGGVARFLLVPPFHSAFLFSLVSCPLIK